MSGIKIIFLYLKCIVSLVLLRSYSNKLIIGIFSCSSDYGVKFWEVKRDVLFCTCGSENCQYGKRKSSND